MRVISGKNKGKRLVSVNGLKVRPTSDKLKGAIFNVLFSLGAIADLERKVVVDIFAGSGALGIEVLSRGAGACYFVDSDADSVAVIKKNLKSVNAEEKGVVISKDYVAGIAVLKAKRIRADIFFLDPPYKNNLTRSAIENIYVNGIFNEGCVIVAEHSSKEELPQTIEKFEKATEKFYNDKALTFYLIK